MEELAERLVAIDFVADFLNQYGKDIKPVIANEEEIQDIELSKEFLKNVSSFVPEYYDEKQFISLIEETLNLVKNYDDLQEIEVRLEDLRNEVIENDTDFESKHKRDELGRFSKKENNKINYLSDENNVYNKFVEVHQNFIEEAPEKFKCNTKEEIYIRLNFGVKGYTTIKSPLEKIIINKPHIDHLFDDNDKERKTFLNYAIKTIENPNIIVKNWEKNFYIKLFFEKDSKQKPHLQIVKTKEDGSFYVTNYRPSKTQVQRIIKEGQIIYDLANLRNSN